MPQFWTHRHRIAVLLGVAACVLACDERKDAEPAKSETKSEDVADAEDAKTAEPTESKPVTADAKTDTAAPTDAKADDGAAETGAPPTPPVEPGEPGPTYFAVRDRGVARLDGGAFAMVTGAPDILLRDMHVAEDGKVYLLGPKGVMRIEGDKATLLAETSFKTTGSVDAFAVTKDGTIWVVGYKGVSKWDGKAWTTEEKSVLGADVTLLKGVAVDGNARVWVASSNKLHTREGEKWAEVDVAKAFPRKPFFDMLRRAPDGIVHALASSALVKAEAPDKITPVDLQIKGFSSLGNLAFADNGTLAVRSKVDAVLVRMPDGTSREYTAGKDFQADSIRTVGVDTQGRAWVGTDIGVAVLGPGDAKAEWNSGSVLELAGQVEQIVPVGAGPTLPTVGEVKRGGLTGKILTDGKGLANTDVELCPSPDMMFKTSPCDDSPVKFAGKTNAEGEFAFDKVPIGAYGLAVKVADKWQLTMSSNFGTKMKEGQTYDIGSIDVKSE